MKIPNVWLKRLYTVGSLKNSNGGLQFALQNRLVDAEVVALREVAIDGEAIALGNLRLELGDQHSVAASQFDTAHPLPFPLRSTVIIQVAAPRLASGPHEIEIAFEARPFGNLRLKVEDAISESANSDDADRPAHLPRDAVNDYSPKIIERRRAFVEKMSGVKLHHLRHYSFDPLRAKGNCENFLGAAQVPIGVAGPLQVNGENANGAFLVPLATSEGTLVASYNRGMKVLNLCGGVRVSVVGDAMQRAPVFELRDARAAREFVKWIEANSAEIRREAEATSSVARLQYVDPYLASKFAYLRFNFSTGDAAGQNMVGRATYAACQWILERYEGIENFFLESNFATDKKSSQINILRTRGKRVTAEGTIPRDVMIKHLRVEPERLVHHYGVANLGSFMSGANNNGLHSANGIAAMFIATGQDVANVAESSAGIAYTELKADGSLYLSLTIPSLIVATYGGGTGLATQRECLEMMGCYGKGKVRRFAEIVAGVAAAGEISLAAAISSSDWVSAHEAYGRNR